MQDGGELGFGARSGRHDRDSHTSGAECDVSFGNWQGQRCPRTQSLGPPESVWFTLSVTAREKSQSTLPVIGYRHGFFAGYTRVRRCSPPDVSPADADRRPAPIAGIPRTTTLSLDAHCPRPYGSQPGDGERMPAAHDLILQRIPAVSDVRNRGGRSRAANALAVTTLMSYAQ